jgi:phosphohistidine phosphatase
MLRLMLLRHATAVPQGSMPDFERVLSEQGLAEAQAISSYCKAELLWPDLALVSPAARTRATHKAFLDQGLDHEVRFEQPLYSFQAEELLTHLQQVPEKVRVLLYVGHNPACADLSLTLTGFGDRYAAMRMRTDFPPASLAVLDFDCDQWQDIGRGAGRLDRFRTAEIG